MSVDLLITNLLQPSLPHPKSEYFIDVEDMKLKIRPVTGADLESLFTGNSSNRAEKLALSCLLSSDPAIPKTPSEVVFVTISTDLEEIDPQANLILGLTCPTCSDSFSIFV